MNGLLHMHGPAVKKLLGWKIGEDEEKWCEKAVEALVKKLKKKSSGIGTLEDLECVLANPSANSRCVTIPKSLDGRLQVSHKKGLPHVIYCRVWRWPDLNSHQELRSIDTCMYPYESSSKTQHICINPYHYQRIARTNSQPHPNHQHPAAFNNFGSLSSPQRIPSPSNIAGWQSSSSTSCASSPSPSVFSEDGDATMLGTSATSSSATSPSSSSAAAAVISKMKPIKSWAQVTYFELNTRIGEAFKLVNPTITIDGYTDPSNTDTRICLGQITNVNRNATVENTRLHIGKGIQLDNVEYKHVFMTNNSETPVFIQSKNTNFMLNQPFNKVCRIPPQNSVCLFDYAQFYQMLEKVRNYDPLVEFSQHCFIRISFVKGWGDDYPRQDVTSTPCWLELRLNVPLAYIDQKIKQTPRISNEANSMT